MQSAMYAFLRLDFWDKTEILQNFLQKQLIYFKYTVYLQHKGKFRRFL